MKDLLLQLNACTRAIIQEVGILAQSQNLKAYLVGGPVRDLILKCFKGDVDIVVEGNAQRLAASFAKAHEGAQIKIYPAFKTASVVLSDGVVIDFTTARSEVYVRPGAYPQITPAGIKEDLYRRDFTVNAMALMINPDAWGRCVDPFGGREDLSSQKIRFLHEQSFIDDPTRILRAARFKVRLNFKIEAKTLKYLKLAIKNKVLDTITPQRYLKDFNKIKKSPEAPQTIALLKSWGADKYIVPLP